jgi:hypothetical protein
MPSDLTFIFGHTHKPYQEQSNFKEYPQLVSVYNTGGWVVDTVDPEPLHGGAIVSLRMYNEDKDIKNYVVKVEEAIHPGEANNSLYNGVQDCLNKNPKNWSEFSRLAAITVSKRAQNLRARINEKA